MLICYRFHIYHLPSEKDLIECFLYSLSNTLDLSSLDEHSIDLSHLMHVDEDIDPSININSSSTSIESTDNVETITQQHMLRSLLDKK